MPNLFFYMEEPNLDRTVRWIGPIDDQHTAEILQKISDLALRNKGVFITLCICSGGGDIGPALAFYDYVRRFDIKLHCVAIGSTSSAAVIIWLAGEFRSISVHTAMIAHPVKQHQKEGLVEIEESDVSIARTKFWNHACTEIVAKCSQGKLKTSDVEAILRERRLLDVEWLLKHKLAHAVF